MANLPLTKPLRVFNTNRIVPAYNYSRAPLVPLNVSLQGPGSTQANMTKQYKYTIEQLATSPFMVNSESYMNQIRREYDLSDNSMYDAMGIIGGVVGGAFGGVLPFLDFSKVQQMDKHTISSLFSKGGVKDLGGDIKKKVTSLFKDTTFNASRPADTFKGRHIPIYRQMKNNKIYNAIKNKSTDDGVLNEIIGKLDDANKKVIADKLTSSKSLRTLANTLKSGTKYKTKDITNTINSVIRDVLKSNNVDDVTKITDDVYNSISTLLKEKLPGIPDITKEMLTDSVTNVYKDTVSETTQKTAKEAVQKNVDNATKKYLSGLDDTARKSLLATSTVEDVTNSPPSKAVYQPKNL